MLQQTGGGNSIAINVSRSLSRLKTLYFSFDNNAPNLVLSTLNKDSFIKEFNNFAHPMNGTFNWSNELEYQVQIGAKIMPSYPVRSAAQSFFELKKSLGIADSAYHSISIRQDQYLRDKFILGLDCEKCLTVANTGLSTKTGDLMVIKCKIANGGAAVIPPKLYITLNSDNILEIRDSGASVYD